MRDTQPARPTRIGVCSWSLRAGSPAELVGLLGQVGASAVQLALDPLRTAAWDEEVTLRELAAARVTIRSGMMGTEGEDYSSLESIRATGGVRPTEHWRANRMAAAENAALAHRLGIRLVSFHAGFLPHERSDRERAVLIERLREIVDLFAAEDVMTAFETGQESAQTLLDVLNELDRPTAGINFDPANMILYGMGDPVAALRLLAPRVRQIHVKDARATRVAGTWGDEVPVGDGHVDWPAFFAVVRESKLTCDLMIEREAGDDRVGDIRLARERVEAWLGISRSRA
jgi:sugar phosphate isomerase/epimerase